MGRASSWTKPPISIPDEDIRLAAYFLWEAEGCPHGRQDAHWLQAQDMLRQRAEDAAAEPKTGETPAALAGLAVVAGLTFMAAMFAGAAACAVGGRLAAALPARKNGPPRLATPL